MRSTLTTGAVAAFVAIAPVVQPPAVVTIEAVVERTGPFVEGLFVGGLTRDDFIVTVDDVEVPAFECVADDRAVSVVVMIDITASAIWPGRVQGAGVEKPLSEDLLAQFRREDRVRFASVGQRVVMADAFTTNRRLTRQGLIGALAPDQDERTGPSPIWDALDTALSALESEPGRRAVILITDGKATGNHKELSEVADRAIALGIPVSTVITGSGPMLVEQGPETRAVVRPELPLVRLSTLTGGLAVVMPGPNSNKPSPLTAAVLALQRTYRISIPSGPADGRFHRVTVRTRDASHRVRARAAFRAPK